MKPWWEIDAFTYMWIEQSPFARWPHDRRCFNWPVWEQQWADSIGLGINSVEGK